MASIFAVSVQTREVFGKCYIKIEMDVEYLGNKELLKLKKTAFYIADKIRFVGVTERNSLYYLKVEYEGKSECDLQ